MQRIGKEQQIFNIEMIQVYPVAPWEERINVIVESDRQKALEIAQDIENCNAIIIAACSSERNGIVGTGGAIRDTTTTIVPQNIDPVAEYTVTLGPRDKFNLYNAELTAMSIALQNLVGQICNRSIVILPSNLAALQAVKRPKHQSGQYVLQQIYKFAYELKTKGNRISAIWVPSQEEIGLKIRAKKAAKQATTEGRTGSRETGAKAAILSTALRNLKEKRGLPRGIGKYTTELDRALPGKHTKLLYDSFKCTEARILAQLRTGMARVNEYLHRIGAAKSDQCACGQASEL